MFTSKCGTQNKNDAYKVMKKLVDDIIDRDFATKISWTGGSRQKKDENSQTSTES